MSKNNPVGDIPIATPILKNMSAIINNFYHKLDGDEVEELAREISSVTDKNCTADIKCIAEMYAQRVEEKQTEI